MNKSKYCIVYAYVLVAFMIVILMGCRQAPPEKSIREIIIRHFENRGYAVMDIRIDGISQIPLGEKQYMGTSGYIVYVSEISLAPVADGKASGEGQRIIIRNATIEIKERSDKKGEWMISDIEGIPLP